MTCTVDAELDSMVLSLHHIRCRRYLHRTAELKSKVIHEHVEVSGASTSQWAFAWKYARDTSMCMLKTFLRGSLKSLILLSKPPGLADHRF